MNDVRIIRRQWYMNDVRIIRRQWHMNDVRIISREWVNGHLPVKYDKLMRWTPTTTNRYRPDGSLFC